MRKKINLDNLIESCDFLKDQEDFKAYEQSVKKFGNKDILSVKDKWMLEKLTSKELDILIKNVKNEIKNATTADRKARLNLFLEVLELRVPLKKANDQTTNLADALFKK